MNNFCLLKSLNILPLISFLLIKMSSWTKDITYNKALLRELSVNLYTSIYDPFREFVANSWDAGSNKIEVKINKSTIEIEDNGSGIENTEQFLNTGSTKKAKLKSASNRPIIGSKGIGKLSAFLLAKKYTIYTNTGDKTDVFSIDMEKAKAFGKTYYGLNDYINHRGTKVLLSRLKKQIDVEELRNYLSERFSPMISREFIDEPLEIVLNSELVPPKEWPKGKEHLINIEQHNKKIKGKLIEPFDSKERNPIFVYHNGVLVNDSFIIPGYSNLAGYLIENWLTVKPDRNSYVGHDKPYQKFKRLVIEHIKKLPIEYNPTAEKLEDTLTESLYNMKHIMKELGLDLLGYKNPEKREERNKTKIPIASNEEKPKKQTYEGPKKYYGLGFKVFFTETNPEEGPIKVEEPNILYVNTRNPHTKWISDLYIKDIKSLSLDILLARGIARLLTSNQTSDNFLKVYNTITTALVKRYTQKHQK